MAVLVLAAGLGVGVGRQAHSSCLCRKRAQSFVSWWIFDAAIGFLIFINAITIGLEADAASKGVDTPWFVVFIDNFLLLVFVLELLLRFFAWGTAASHCFWVL